MNGRMVQHTNWEAQRTIIETQYGVVPWITYCCNECERMASHGIDAELRYNTRGEVSIWVNKIE